MADKQPEGFDWIEAIVNLMALMGFNKVRVRWKLMKWRDETKRAGVDAAGKARHIRYEHKTCPECGAVNDKDATVCAACQAKLTSRNMQMLGRLGLSVPEALTVSAALCLAMVVIYLRMALGPNSTGLWGFDVSTLILHGGQWTPAVHAGQWWRLGTSIFLHAGLWHIGFNVFALWQLGPAIEDLYGRGKMLFLFMATGIAASLVSDLFINGVGIGASGAIMGLIGIAAGWGQRDGTTQGRLVRNRMIKWAVYVMIFGFFIRANNVAHAVGFLSGGALGYFLPARARGRTMVPGSADVIMGLLGGAAAAASIFVTLFPPASSEKWAYESFSAEGGMRGVAGDTRAGGVFEPDVEQFIAVYTIQRRACTLHDIGSHRDAALTWATMTPEVSEKEALAYYTPEMMGMACDAQLEMRDRCVRYQEIGLEAIAPDLREAGAVDAAAVKPFYDATCKALLDVWPAAVDEPALDDDCAEP